jgi:3-oxoacyl-[acyl-carrier protein] reductase
VDDIRAEAAAHALKGITDKDGRAVSVVVAVGTAHLAEQLVAAAVKEFEQLEGDGDERRVLHDQVLNA